MMIKKILIKINDFTKFVEYITDSVRSVQQNSRHSVGIINQINNYLKFVCTMLPPIPIT